MKTRQGHKRSALDRTAFKHTFVYLSFLWFCLSGALLHAAPPGLGEDLGDYYYNIGEYDLARIEFERSYRTRKKAGKPTGKLPQKIALSIMRKREFRKTIPFLSGQGDFSGRYLFLYSALRTGHAFEAQRLSENMERDPELSERQRELARLLAGSIELEYGNYPEAKRLYSSLLADSGDSEIRLIAGQVLDSLKGYETLESKSAVLAGIYSALLPGAGQFYTEFYVDGGVALFFNTMFLGSSIALYNLENEAGRPHRMSILTGIIGLGFYISNIFGAIGSAHRYNNYQKRKFHQDIRRHFFNIDFVEQTSGIEFRERF